MIKMQPVKSAYIKSFGYDARSTRLYITFKTGLTYCYEGVGQVVYNKLLEARDTGASIGTVFWSDINGHYEYRRLTG